MQFTNKMTFMPEEYAKLADSQKTALHDVRKEARDKAPSRSISAAAIAPKPAAALALAPVQRTIQAIGLVPTSPAAPPAENGNDIHQLLSNAASRSANQAQQAPIATTTSDIFVHDGANYQVGYHNIQCTVNNNTTSSKLERSLMVVPMIA
jgi:hypothetical protein